MDTAALALLWVGLVGIVLVILSVAVLARVVITAARSGRIRARGGLKVPGVSLEGEIDASSEK